MATIRQRQGKWQAVIRRTGHPSASKMFATKTAAKDWARAQEARIDRGEQGTVQRCSFADIFAGYQTVSPESAWGRSKRATLLEVSNYWATTRIDQLTVPRIVRWIQEKEAGGAGAVTNGSLLAWLRTIIRYGLGGLGMQAAIPLERIDNARAALAAGGRVARPNERDRLPTDDELAQLYAFWASSERQQIPMGDITKMALATAMRQGEITGLLWEDYDRHGRTILVRDRKDPRKKVGNHMTVPLLLNNGIDPVAIIEQQRKVSGNRGRIFPCNSKSVSGRFLRSCNKLGIEGLTFHDLRHAGITALFKAGYTIEQVAVVSGHRSWAQLKRYTNLTAADLQDHPSQEAVQQKLRAV